ncbi:site-specific integrase [Nonlabens sp. YIK11]|uniref:site-specific integrase n=1 Tax=Nonlabens sp. YIK11 TaxID=1453349 RepID=UPI001E61AE83|nr:site-specific integrase [Nonlabens sp. YIK11]
MAYKMEWLAKDPFVKFKPTYVRNEREYLSELELQGIIEKQFGMERLNLVKDLFIFACYTGLSYIDLIQLKMDNISLGIDGNYWIVTNRQKTNNRVKIPLLDIPQQLIDKYRDHPKSVSHGTLFPKMSNQKLNSYLKEIADLCGITKNLTFHIARHTFATTVTLSNGVPIETVSKLLGHTKLSTTQIYARVIERKVCEDMIKLKLVLAEKSIKDGKMGIWIMDNMIEKKVNL